MARFILLTGLIGSGKSYVAKMLRDKRYIVVDSDSFAKSLYDDPGLYKLVVERLGLKCLTDDGKIDLGYVRDYLLGTSPDDPMNIAWAVASRVATGISFKYDSSKEVIFVEAAPTRQVGQVCIWLGIKQAVVVRTDEELRRKRLRELRGLPDSTIDAFDNLQSIDHVSHAIFPQVSMKVTDTHVVMRDLWNLPGIDINGDLMDILEKDIAPTPEEKFALYERYLRESPDYCKQNAMCYSFYNLGGCNNCPFPCSQQDRNFEQANREFMKEKKNA